jgi:hypothetical protein
MADYTRKKIKVIYKDPGELIPYSKNARTHDSEIEFLCNSIKAHGFDASHAIGVDKNMVIIHGHGRRLAAMKLGMKEVPVVVRSDLSDEQVMAFRLADNKVSDMSGWDFDLLDQELAFLKDMDFDMTQFGFEDFSRFEEPEPAYDEDDDEDETIVVAESSKRENGGAIESYRLIIECKDAKEQKALFEELDNRGFYCQMMI